MHDEGTELSPELIEMMRKVGGQEYGRLAFEHLVGDPPIGVVALTLMQKTASVADLELYRAAEQASPEDPIELYEQLGGGFKLAGVVDRAKGLSRVGELLSGSRASTLRTAKEEARGDAGKHLLGAMKYDHTKVTPRITKAVHEGTTHKLPASDQELVQHAHAAHQNKVHGTRAERLGKVLGAEEHKVRSARGVAGGAVAGGVAGGVAAARHKNADK